MGEEPARGDDGQESPGVSFDQRLAAARKRAGLDAPPPAGQDGQAPDDPGALNLAMRLGIELVAAMVIAVAIGYGLDRLFHTSPWFMIAFVPVGAIAGFRNLMRAMGPRPPRG
ncbi:MAG TPA: AtpZ/AtpI family protein [Acetobacteraceae bacterium]|nr:AtpZ/AtpI family protein [Acetobacteraceae bacterium]